MPELMINGRPKFDSADLENWLEVLKQKQRKPAAA